MYYNSHQMPDELRQAVYTTAMLLQNWQSVVRQGLTQDDFMLYLKMWELVAINAPDAFGMMCREILRPSEVEILPDVPDVPDVFDEFINSLDF